MNKFLFKSTDADLQKMLVNKLDMLLAEQRQQRHDLSNIIKNLHSIRVSMDTQKQVDDYFEEDAEDKAEQVPETSPQTDTVKQ